MTISTSLVPALVRALLAMIAAAAVALVGAAPVHADQGTAFTLSTNRAELRSGQQLVAQARANAVCDWLVEWTGVRSSGRGRNFTAKFTAPAVEERTRFSLRATCFTRESARKARPAAPPAHLAQRSDDSEVILVRVPARVEHTVVITVLPPTGSVSPPAPGGVAAGPDGHGGHGSLPNTGGPPRWMVLGGIASLLIGLAATRASRESSGTPLISRVR